MPSDAPGPPLPHSEAGTVKDLGAGGQRIGLKLRGGEEALLKKQWGCQLPALEEVDSERCSLEKQRGQV